MGRLSIDLQPFRVAPQTPDDVTAEDLPRVTMATENGVPDTVIEIAPQTATLNKKVVERVLVVVVVVVVVVNGCFGVALAP